MRQELTNGSASLPTGVYRHKESGEELICIATEKFGNPQADAAVRLGFEYKGKVEGNDKETVNAMPDPHAAPVATPQGVKSVAELKSELAEAEEREASFDDRKKEAEKVNKVAENSVANSNPANVKKGK
jgi:hypothetical protein